MQAQQSSTAPLTKAQLEQLVAPIALHPDPLLSQMLMASTYPTEVVQAARWLHENSGLTGPALQDAAQKQPWESSVRALTSVPQALEMMSDKLDWTQRLGDAFLAQQEELLAAVQRLRQRAEAAGHLKTSDQQKVSVVTPPEGGTKAAPRAQQSSKQAARSKQASRPRTATHRPQPRGHAATRGPQHGYRPAGGGQRMSMRGGGPRHGGGGRRGRR